MTRTTSELRGLWSPPCTGPWARVELFGGGKVTVRPAIIDAVVALDDCLVAHDYETRRADTGAYNCRPITGGSNYSLHAYGIALDINWSTNPYGKRLKTDMPPEMVEDIEGIRTRRGAQVWRWGGRYSGNKDAMHFEVVASPAEIAQGIDLITVPGRLPDQPKPQPKPPVEEDMPKIVRVAESGTLWNVGAVRWPIEKAHADLLVFNRLAIYDDKGQPFSLPRKVVELVPQLKP